MKAKPEITAAIAVAAVIVGITLILVWWRDVVSLFKAGTGIALSIGGLLALYSLKK